MLAGQTAQLGPAYVGTLRTKGNLATLLDEMGEDAEARRLCEEVVAGQTALRGRIASSEESGSPQSHLWF